ncbi:MAG: bifunctional nuclease family protein [Ferruginibacter sp.]
MGYRQYEENRTGNSSLITQHYANPFLRRCIGRSKWPSPLAYSYGGFEAQAIAVALERMSPSRPLTHDLMKNFMLAFNVELHEVVINDLQEGIFYSKLGLQFCQTIP